MRGHVAGPEVLVEPHTATLSSITRAPYTAVGPQPWGGILEFLRLFYLAKTEGQGRSVAPPAPHTPPQPPLFPPRPGPAATRQAAPHSVFST